MLVAVLACGKGSVFTKILSLCVYYVMHTLKNPKKPTNKTAHVQTPQNKTKPRTELTGFSHTLIQPASAVTGPTPHYHYRGREKSTLHTVCLLANKLVLFRRPTINNISLCQINRNLHYTYCRLLLVVKSLVFDTHS